MLVVLCIIILCLCSEATVKYFTLVHNSELLCLGYTLAIVHCCACHHSTASKWQAQQVNTRCECKLSVWFGHQYNESQNNIRNGLFNLRRTEIQRFKSIICFQHDISIAQNQQFWSWKVPFPQNSKQAVWTISFWPWHTVYDGITYLSLDAGDTVNHVPPFVGRVYHTNDIIFLQIQLPIFLCSVVVQWPCLGQRVCPLRAYTAATTTHTYMVYRWWSLHKGSYRCWFSLYCVHKAWSVPLLKLISVLIKVAMHIYWNFLNIKKLTNWIKTS